MRIDGDVQEVELADGLGSPENPVQTYDERLLDGVETAVQLLQEIRDILLGMTQ